MLVGEAIYALELDQQSVTYHKIGDVIADMVGFVANGERYLGFGRDTAQQQLPQEGSLIDFLEESRAQDSRHFES